MIPAQQRLRPDDPLVRKAKDRLVMQHKLVFFQRPAQFVEQREAAADAAGQAGVPRSGAVRTAELCFLQRDVEIAQRIVLAEMGRVLIM